MSNNDNDYTYNSSSNEDEITISPSSLPANCRPPPGLIFPSQSPPQEVQLLSVQQKYTCGFLKMSEDEPENGNNVVEPISVDSELGIDLGRRLARLELGNELNKEELDKIKKRCEINEEIFVNEKPLSCHNRIDELEGKVVALEARLSSQEKQGFDTKEKIEILEKNLKRKDNEILVLRDILANQMTERKKDENRVCKQEEGSRQLNSQFLTLIETCKTFNEDLQSLKKTNLEIKRELKKKENMKGTTPKTSPATVHGPGSYATHGIQNTTQTKNTYNFSPTWISDSLVKVSQHPSISMPAPSVKDVHSEVRTKSKANSFTPNVYAHGQEFIPRGFQNCNYQGTSQPIYYQVQPQIPLPQPNFVFHSGTAMQGAELQKIQNRGFF